MYRKMKNSAQKAVLSEINKVLRKLFRYLADHDECTFDELTDYMGPEGEAFARRCSENRKLAGIMERFFQVPRAVRESLYEAVENDLEFERHICEDDFVFEEVRLDHKTRAILKAFMDALYDQEFSTGRGVALEGKPDKTEVRRKWFDENPIAFCPVCLDPKADFCQVSEMEHYFPRCRYPAVAFHPVNLHPTCKECNHSKSRRDPLKKASLNELFIPYLRPAADETKLDLIGMPGKRRLGLVPRDVAEPQTEKRIKNFEELFKLESRWEKKSNQIIREKIDEILAVETDERGMENYLRDQIMRLERMVIRYPQKEPELICMKFLAGKGWKALLEEFRRRKAEQQHLAEVRKKEE